MQERQQAMIAVDVVLGVGFAGLLVVTAMAIADSWGGGYWLFDVAAGLVVCAAAILRRHRRVAAAAVGLGVAAVATVTSWAAGLPQEPGPAMALALAVLVGSSVWTLPTRLALAVSASGFAVAIGAYCAAQLSSSAVSGVAAINVAGWLGGVVVGLLGRQLQGRSRRLST